MRETMGVTEIKGVRYGYSSYWRCGPAMGRLTICYFIDGMNTLHYGWTLCHERVKMQDSAWFETAGVGDCYKVTAIARGDQFKKVIGRGRAFQALIKRPRSIVHDPDCSPMSEIIRDIEKATHLEPVFELPKPSERV